MDGAILVVRIGDDIAEPNGTGARQKTDCRLASRRNDEQNPAAIVPNELAGAAGYLLIGAIYIFAEVHGHGFGIGIKGPLDASHKEGKGIEAGDLIGARGFRGLGNAEIRVNAFE